VAGAFARATSRNTARGKTVPGQRRHRPPTAGSARVQPTPTSQSDITLHNTNSSSPFQKSHCSADAMGKKSTTSPSTGVSRTKPKMSLPKTRTSTSKKSTPQTPNRNQCLCVNYKQYCAKEPRCAKVTHKSRAYCHVCALSAGSIYCLIGLWSCIIC
jgi:hypothetical protein